MYVCLEEDKKVKNTTQIHVTVLRRQALVFRPTKRDLIALLTHTECRIFLNFRQLFFRETPLRFMVLWMRLVRTTKITDRPPYIHHRMSYYYSSDSWLFFRRKN
jgi:hypothetical protein